MFFASGQPPARWRLQPQGSHGGTEEETENSRSMLCDMKIRSTSESQELIAWAGGAGERIEGAAHFLRFSVPP